MSPPSRRIAHVGSSAESPINSPEEVVVKALPTIETSLLLRTDYSDDAAWASLCEAVQRPNEDGFTASVRCISDPAYDRLTVASLVALRRRASSAVDTPSRSARIG